MRYRWSIKVGDAWYAGTDANVFLSLAGDQASMREVQISDPDAINDWEKGDTYHGMLETEDLGEIQTGTLRHDHLPIRLGAILSFAALGAEGEGGMLHGLEDRAREVQEMVFAIILARDLRASRRGEPPDLLTSALSSAESDQS